MNACLIARLVRQFRRELLLQESLFMQTSATGPDHYFSSLMRRHNANDENTVRQVELIERAEFPRVLKPTGCSIFRTKWPKTRTH